MELNRIELGQFLQFFALFFQKHVLFGLFKEFILQACVLLDQNKVIFLDFFQFLEFKLKLMLIVSTLIDKEYFILIKIHTLFIHHNFLINILISLLRKHKIVPHPL